jgi:hypothetical protein
VGGPVLVTIVDRVSKYTLMALAPSKRADDVGGVIYGLLERLSRENQNRDIRQWKGICLPPYSKRSSPNRLLLCPSLPFLGARTQREYQWVDSSVFSEKIRLLKTNRCRSFESAKPPQFKTKKNLGLRHPKRHIFLPTFRCASKLNLPCVLNL